MIPRVSRQNEREGKRRTVVCVGGSVRGLEVQKMVETR